MIIQKIFILFFLLFFTQFKPGELNSSDNQNNSGNSFNHLADKGLTIEKISSYYNYLLNSDINFVEERKLLDKLPQSVITAFSRSVLLKREMKFNEMYDSLYKYLNQFPEFYYYYDELVFSGRASNKLEDLKNHIKKIKFPNHFNNYFHYLISSSEGKYSDALQNLNTVIKKDSALPELYYNLSYIYRNLGDYEKALAVLDFSRAKFKENEQYIVKTFNPIGSLYFLSGDYETAEKFYKEGLISAKNSGDKINESKSLINLGIIADINGNIENARSLFEKAYLIAQKINDVETSALALSELGVSYTFTNNIIDAKNNYLKSYSLYKRTGDRNRLSLLSNNIGKIYLQMFDYKSAIKIFNEGLELASENKRGQILNLTGLADAYSNLSNYTEAIKYYKNAEEISSEIKEVSLIAETKISLGTLNYNLNHFKSALEIYLSAEELLRETDDPYLNADLFYKMGASYLQTNNFDKAEESLKKSEDISIKNLDFLSASLSTNMLAKTYLKKNEYDKTEIALKRAKDYGIKAGWKYLVGLNEILKGELNSSKNNFSAAITNFENTIKIAKEINDFDLLIESSFLLGKVYQKQNLTDQAKKHFVYALNLIEDVSRPLFGDNEIQISYLSAKSDIYKTLTELYLDQKNYKEAFETIDKFRSRNMIANLVNLKLESLIKKREKIEKIYEYDWILHSGIYSEEETDSIKKEFITLKEELAKDNPILKNYLNPDRNFTIKDIQKSINKNETLVTLYSTESKTYIFLLSKDYFKPVEINISKEEIENLISSVSPYFSFSYDAKKPFFNQDLFSFNAAASNKFYNIFLKNALSEIPDNQNLIFSPSAELIYFPFELLVTSYYENQSPYSYKEKKYLINKFNISYSPSASAYVEQKQNMLKNSEKILVVGDPSIDTDKNDFAERRGLLEETGTPRNIALLPLRYSGEEVDEITSLINADHILLSSNATETNFKENAEYSKIIHLSTHSFLYNMQPLIFFSNVNDKKNDGFLEAGEIVQLNLNSDLVVLSSCNSGLGNVDEAEGILGMTKAFFEAGAKSIVVSLWDVNDKYTSKFMTLFYKKLSEGYNKSEALRYTKIDFIKEYSANPYYWSAFVLSGNIEEITMKNYQNIDTFFLGILSIVVLSSIIITIHKKKNKKISSLS